MRDELPDLPELPILSEPMPPPKRVGSAVLHDITMAVVRSLPDPEATNRRRDKYRCPVPVRFEVKD